MGAAEDFVPPERHLSPKPKGPSLLFSFYFPLAPTTDPSFVGMTSWRVGDG
jgi:hypothetical protein